MAGFAMGAITKVTLDHQGMGEILNSDKVRALVDYEAWAIADDVRRRIRRNGVDKYPVVVDNRMTAGMQQDRQAADIAITHPAGAALQAKYGVLTQAALARGLDMNGPVGP